MSRSSEYGNETSGSINAEGLLSFQEKTLLHDDGYTLYHGPCLYCDVHAVGLRSGRYLVTARHATMG
jgi:hypothetical protein